MATKDMMKKIKDIREGRKAEETPATEAGDRPLPSPWINDPNINPPKPVPTDNL